MRLNTCFTNITGGYSKGCGQEAMQGAKGEGRDVKDSSEGAGGDKAC